MIEKCNCEISKIINYLSKWAPPGSCFALSLLLYFYGRISQIVIFLSLYPPPPHLPPGFLSLFLVLPMLHCCAFFVENHLWGAVVGPFFEKERFIYCYHILITFKLVSSALLLTILSSRKCWIWFHISSSVVHACLNGFSSPRSLWKAFRTTCVCDPRN